MNIEITFEDHGQDFLRWIINSEGVITESSLQGWLWEGRKVLNKDELVIGGQVYITHGNGETLWIKYPIEKLERVRKEEGSE